MSGFGRGSAPLGGGRLVVELKSVNHRFLEVRSRSPRELLNVEPLVDKLVRARLRRGHLTALVTLETVAGAATRVDDVTLREQLEQLRSIADEFELRLADLAPLLSGSPDVFHAEPVRDQRQLERAVERALGEALDALISMRDREGAAMAAELARLLETARGATADLERIVAGQPDLLLERARKRVAALLEGTDIKVDPARIEAESALLADRADVTEEIARLGSHCDQLSQLLGADEPVGRRLEFLVQEMGREANTLAAKAALPEATHAAVELKAEIEKIREIAQNVE
jgi:uncharacterized protein (TIGR00255 family)